jgi:hypothetical protein
LQVGAKTLRKQVNQCGLDSTAWLPVVTKRVALREEAGTIPWRTRPFE